MGTWSRRRATRAAIAMGAWAGATSVVVLVVLWTSAGYFRAEAAATYRAADAERLQSEQMLVLLPGMPLAVLATGVTASLAFLRAGLREDPPSDPPRPARLPAAAPPALPPRAPGKPR